MTLDQIDDIELLRKAALLLQEDNKKLVRLIAKMKKELHALRGGDPEQLKLTIADLEQQLAKRNQMLFGDKSEKRSRADEPHVANLGRKEWKDILPTKPHDRWLVLADEVIRMKRWIPDVYRRCVARGLLSPKVWKAVATEGDAGAVLCS